MAERTNARLLKSRGTSVPVGSNPTPSANSWPIAVLETATDDHCGVGAWLRGETSGVVCSGGAQVGSIGSVEGERMWVPRRPEPGIDGLDRVIEELGDHRKGERSAALGPPPDDPDWRFRTGPQRDGQGHEPKLVA